MQQNWKVKRQRVAVSAPSNEGFTFDLFDSSLYDSVAVFRPSALSPIRVEQDSAGMLAINLPQNSCRSLRFGFLGVGLRTESDKKNNTQSVETSREIEEQPVNDDDFIEKTHSLLREVHKSIFSEQVDFPSFPSDNFRSFSTPNPLNKELLLMFFFHCFFCYRSLKW